MIGDSLFNRPINEHNLIGKLNALIDYPLKFVNQAHNGAKIHDVLNNLPSVVATNPDAYMLYWDSDNSDISEAGMTADQVKELRGTYVANLQKVIDMIKSQGKYLVVSGPEVLGEGPLGMPQRFWGKVDMLNEYRDMVAATCKQNNIDYIDMRSIFLQAPWYGKIISCCYYTLDGEHENERGTALVASEFAKVINSKWIPTLPQPNSGSTTLEVVQ
jgi:hypothetical protein